MKRLIIIILVTISGHCFGSTFQLDTIDNWQIYNGKKLLLSGHDGGQFHVTIKKSKLKDLEIQYNHCVKHKEDYIVSIEITDKDDNSIIISAYSVKPDNRITIPKSDILLWKEKVLKIKYSEHSENNPIKVTLGQITLE